MVAEKTPRGRMNCVHHVRIRSKVEANMAPSEVLEALKQQIFNLEIRLQVPHLLARVEICRDRRDRQSCKIFAICVIFFR